MVGVIQKLGKYFIYQSNFTKIISEFYDDDLQLRKNEHFNFLIPKIIKEKTMFSNSDLLGYLNFSPFEIFIENSSNLDLYYFNVNPDLHDYRGSIRYTYSPIMDDSGNFSIKLSEIYDNYTILSLNYRVDISFP